MLRPNIKKTTHKSQKQKKIQQLLKQNGKHHFHYRFMVVNTLFCRVPGSARKKKWKLMKNRTHTWTKIGTIRREPFSVRVRVCVCVCAYVSQTLVCVSKPIIPIIIPKTNWSLMSSDFDDDIDFDPDDLTILLHFFRKLWYRLPGVPEGILQTTTATVTTISAILLSIRDPSVALVLHHHLSATTNSSSTTATTKYNTTKQPITSNPSFVPHLLLLLSSSTTTHGIRCSLL